VSLTHIIKTIWFSRKALCGCNSCTPSNLNVIRDIHTFNDSYYNDTLLYLFR